jgi:hypothetical protein
MKKIYNKPTTEAIQLLGQNAIMAGSSRFILGPGNDGAPGGND